MPSPIVEVHVECHYRLGFERPILEDVHWVVEPGEHWAIVGANGAGKSTLLAIVAGDPWPSRGVIRVLGHEYGHVDKRELKKRIGVVSAALYGSFPSSDTALEITASGLEARVGRLGALGDAAEARAHEALVQVGAESIAEKPYGVLSQGERQRCMIARALIARPALLILDEPCAGLDPAARERFLRDLERLAASGGPTQVLVTHHLEEIPPFVTHALLLREGRVVSAGPVETTLISSTMSEVLDAPCTVTSTGAGASRRFELRMRG